MTDPGEMHEKAWSTRGSAPVPEEDPEREAVSRETEGLRRFRPGKQDELPPELVERYEAARAAVVRDETAASTTEALDILQDITEEILGHTSYEDTEGLVRGEEVVVTADPNPPWEKGERLQIVDEKWKPACVAVVVSRRISERDSTYRLRGVSPGRLDG